VSSQKSSSKNKKGNAPREPWQGVVLYRLGEDSEKGAALRALLGELGIKARTVDESQLGEPVGALVGLPGFKSRKLPYAGEVPTCEFMLVHLPDAALTALLLKMRDAGISVGCKATVTPTNKLWPFGALVQEVSAEHAMMTSARTDATDE
jgi:hypothetical protein